MRPTVLPMFGSRPHLPAAVSFGLQPCCQTASTNVDPTASVAARLPEEGVAALEEAVRLELAPWLSAPLRIAQAFLAGNRDPGLVDDPDIDPIDIVELLRLLEALDGRSPAGSRAIGDG
jgi:hypothetical protein